MMMMMELAMDQRLLVAVLAPLVLLPLLQSSSSSSPASSIAAAAASSIAPASESSSSSSTSSSSSSSSASASYPAAINPPPPPPSDGPSSSDSSSSRGRSFPALFAFGDSLSDAGNNNFIFSAAKANKLPYGIDFPGGANGRFTNGKTVIDYLCERLSLPPRPPYLDPRTRGAVVLQGVNYASGSSGLVRATGFNFIGRVYLETQLGWFRNTIDELKRMIGDGATRTLLARSLFTLSAGSNDYLNNYLLELSPTATRYTAPQFQALLLGRMSSYLDRLYAMGARNVFVFALGPLGCIPTQLLAQRTDGRCSAAVNELCLGFNRGLRDLVGQFNARHRDANATYLDSFDLALSIISKPRSYGFRDSRNACCGAGKFNARVLCLPFLKPCPNRDDYVFFDGFHPTQRLYRFVANETIAAAGL